MISKNDELEQAIKSLENTKISNILEQFSGDLNTIKTTGFTYATGTASNIPVTGYSFYITTIALNEYYTYQEARRVDENTNNFNTYERQCYGGKWTDWRHIDCQKITTGVEFETGRIIDGKKEYGKRIDFGVLPKNSSKSVAHNITNANKITGYQTFAYYKDGRFGGLTIPRAVGNDYIELQLTETDIFIASNIDASYFNAEIEIYYTKN